MKNSVSSIPSRHRTTCSSSISSVILLTAIFLFSLTILTAAPREKADTGSFQLSGHLEKQGLVFELNLPVSVTDRKGEKVFLLEGDVVLLDLPESRYYKICYESGRYLAAFNRPGNYRVKVRFLAHVEQQGEWRKVNFRIPTAPLRPVMITGFDDNTKVDIFQATEPEWRDGVVHSWLSPSPRLEIQWKKASPEVKGKLFYGIEASEIVSVASGLLRQTQLLNLKIMQGELRQFSIGLSGKGEIIRIDGDDILSWKVENLAAADAGGAISPGKASRRVIINMNQTKSHDFSLLLHSQTPLEGFPATVNPLKLVPEDAIRYSGQILVLNQGAVRIDVNRSDGLSQISPEIFSSCVPSFDTQELKLGQRQAFAYRFAGSDFTLGIQADNILPEVAVNVIGLYKLGILDTSLDFHLELEIREAPLREFSFDVPVDYSVSVVESRRLSDYYRNEINDNSARLQLVFSEPVSGRQVVRLRLEKNRPEVETLWQLPVVKPTSARSYRGFLGIAAEEGFRLRSSTGNRGLTEIATSFFPSQQENLQLAYRIREPNWQTSIDLEQLQASVQADAFHLFSLGEGIAYGSSLVNFGISGAPVQEFEINVPEYYRNIEFTGSNIRNWKNEGNGIYRVTLHAPVSGDYTLLTTYEINIAPAGATLDLSGVTPLKIQSEQGYQVVVSHQQFRINQLESFESVLAIDKDEIPAEYQLLFDAPVLAAYQYSSRPLQNKLEVTPYDIGESLNQLADYCEINYRLASTGEIVAHAEYLLKSKTREGIRLELPHGMTLWSLTIDGEKVNPVAEEKSILVPLSADLRPGKAFRLRIEYAGLPGEDEKFQLAPPNLAVPILYSKWNIYPEAGNRLEFISGNIVPEKGSIPKPMSTRFQELWQRLRPSTVLLTCLGMALAGLMIGNYLRGKREEEPADESSFKILYALFSLAGALTGIGIGLYLYAKGQSSLPRSPDYLQFINTCVGGNQDMSVTVRHSPLLIHDFSSLSLVLLATGVVFLLVSYLTISFGRLMGASRIFSFAGKALGWVMVAVSTMFIEHGETFLFVVISAFLFLPSLMSAIAQILHILMSWLKDISPGILKLKQTPSLHIVLAALLLPVMGSMHEMDAAAADDPVATPSLATVLPGTVTLNGSIKNDHAVFHCQFDWNARSGEQLPVLLYPGVIMKLDIEQKNLKLIYGETDGKPLYSIKALREGSYKVAFDYQIPVQDQNDGRLLVIPSVPGLIYEGELTIDQPDYTIESMSIAGLMQIDFEDRENTHLRINLKPGWKTKLFCKPKLRDTSHESVVFYTECWHLFLPRAGVVEGAHRLLVKSAQGEIRHLKLGLPPLMSVASVKTEQLSGWRFDPETRVLEINFERSRKGHFPIYLRTQISAGSLPYEEEIMIPRMLDAAGQVNWLGLSTSNEIQLGEMEPGEGISTINIDDFPSDWLTILNEPELTSSVLRRAYRVADSNSGVKIKAVAVEPEIRVQSRESLSLGEDRSILSVGLDLDILRAGIFRVSFILPQDYEVESISGRDFSHWNEDTIPGNDTGSAGKKVTVHFNRKLIGPTRIHISLAGPGLPDVVDYWEAPRLRLQEVNKFKGVLSIMPEQGMRLNIRDREGLTQMDPENEKAADRGQMVFRLLHENWYLTLGIQRIDPWVEVTGLQDVSFREGALETRAKLHYTIKNSGLKSFLIQVPENALAINFNGVDIAGYELIEEKKGLWLVSLNKRIIGEYLLELSFRELIEDASSTSIIYGVQAEGVDLQRGFLSLRSLDRLMLTIDNLPASLQTVEWQMIPEMLRKELSGQAHYNFRTLTKDFSLPVSFERHKHAPLLPAKVVKTDLVTLVSSRGLVLTRVEMQLEPGDKRYLRIRLPEKGEFWYAIVNGKSVWPWKDRGEYLIPLSKSTLLNGSIPVEFIYAVGNLRNVGKPDQLSTTQLTGPEFDLPLQQITWEVFIPENLKAEDWDGSLTPGDVGTGIAGKYDLNFYLNREVNSRKSKIQAAEKLLTLGNELIQAGKQEEALEAMESAYVYSAGDAAFNEDARIQLNNLRQMQGMVGLTQRRSNLNTQSAQGHQAMNLSGNAANTLTTFTQQDADQILSDNSLDERKVMSGMVARLINQQDSARPMPSPINAVIPELGQGYTFRRPLQVNAYMPMSIEMKVKTLEPDNRRKNILFIAFLALGLIAVELLRTKGEALLKNS